MGFNIEQVCVDFEILGSAQPGGTVTWRQNRFEAAIPTRTIVRSSQGRNAEVPERNYTVFVVTFLRRQFTLYALYVSPDFT